MEVSVRQLRNETSRVISAVQSGQHVVLTVYGRPVADIVPHQDRSERRPSALLLADLANIRATAARLGVRSDSKDFDTGLTTDDMI